MSMEDLNERTSVGVRKMQRAQVKKKKKEKKKKEIDIIQT